MKNIFKLNEAQLINVIKSKNEQASLKQLAKDRLFDMHRNLVKSIALKFINVDCELQDLLQEGYRGLNIAIKKFDCKRNIKLTTYAYKWIFQSIQRSVQTNSRMIVVPQTMEEKHNYLQKVKDDFFSSCGYYPTISELAEIVGMKEEKVVKILHSCEGVGSLDKVVAGGNNKEITGAMFIADDKLTPSEQVIQDENKLEFYKLLRTILTEREYYVICWQAGLNAQELTIKEIANKLSLSIPRIKQILNEVRNKIYSCQQMRDIWNAII